MKPEEKKFIVESVTDLFIQVDERNWDALRELFDDNVKLDYTSMGAAEVVELSPEEIAEMWKSQLTLFDHTHHEITNFKTELADGIANLYCYGTAWHHLENDIAENYWTVVGTYNFKLLKFGACWKITEMKFNYKFDIGNKNLVNIAREM